MRFAFLFTISVAIPAFGTSVFLGTASSFGLLGGTISNTGTSVVAGDVGAITSVTGFPPGVATGTVFTTASDPTVVAAFTDFETAFTLASGDVATQSVTDLTMDRTFTGNNVYSFPSIDVTSTAGVDLTFDAQSDSSEVFIVKIGGALTVNGPLQFTLLNGAIATNIYWIVGGAVTINPGSAPVTWDGNILTGTSFTMSASSGAFAGTINGCVLAETANTLAAETQVNGCAAAASSSVPEPGTAGQMALGCVLGVIGLRKLRA